MALLVPLDLLVLLALLGQLDLLVLLDRKVQQALRVPLALLDQLEQLDLQVPRALQVPVLRSLTTTLQRLGRQHLAVPMPMA